MTLVAKARIEADGRVSLLAPAVGLWRGGPARGAVVTPGMALGAIEVLGVAHALAAPTDARGAVVDLPASALARRPVGFGDVLAVLDPRALGEAAVGPAAAAIAADAGGLALRAPSSGRYYSKPAPGKPAFVTVGDELATGHTVCLLEVMKTFNRVTYGGDGLPDRARVTAIVPADGDDLDQGAVILRLEPMTP